MKNIKLYELEETYRNEESSLEYPAVSYTMDTEKVWYKERPIPSQFIATYNVTSTTSTTQILGRYFNTSQVKEMYIDEVKQGTIVSGYTFSTTGDHTVKCVMNDENFTSCGFMFGECYDLTSLDLSNFNTSAVTSMSFMFQNCRSLTSLDLSNFDTSKVTSMISMFEGCSGLTSLDLSSFDTSNVKDIDGMFNGCSSLTSLDLSNFNMSKITRPDMMFANCNSLTSLDLSNWDTSNVTRMTSMFSNCSGLTSLDLSSFDTSKVTDMSYMFQNCRSLTSITFGPQANVSNVTSNDSFTNMFGDSNNSFNTLETQGTLYFPKKYTSSWKYILVYYNMISMFPPTWTGIPIDYENGETVPTV